MVRAVKQTIQLTPLRISNGALALKNLPKRLKLFAWGRNETLDGPVFIDDRTVAVFNANQKRYGFDRVALDYEHNTVPGSPEFERTVEPRKVAAYGAALVMPGDGLYMVDLDYTPSGKDNALEYIDLSPTPVLGKGREVLALHSSALCRHGAVEGLTYFSVSIDVAGDPATKQEDSTVDKLLDMFRAALASPQATLEDVTAKLKDLFALAAKAADLEGRLTTLSSELTAAKAEAAKVPDLTGKVATLMATLAGYEKDLVCYHARLEGKVIPLSADAIAKADVATLKDMVAKLEKGKVPLHPLTAEAIREPGAAGATVLTEEDKKVGKLCGLSAEAIAKANGLKVAAAVLIAALGFGLAAQATSLVADRETPEREGKRVALTASSNVFYYGSMVCENGSGVAVPATDGSGYAVVGTCDAYLDNSGALYSSANKVTVRRGVFRWENGGSFTAANIGDLAFVEDDQTVTTAAAASYDIVAGIIVDVDTLGVWVDSYAVGGRGVASLTSATVSGAASVGSLTVSGATALQGGVTLTGVETNTGVQCNGSADITSALTVGGAASLQGGLNVTGPIKSTGINTNAGIVCSGPATFSGAGNLLTIAGTNVVLSALPTATNGLTTGMLWNDSGTLKIKN